MFCSGVLNSQNVCGVCQFFSSSFFSLSLSHSFIRIVFDISRIYSLTYTYIHISNTQMMIIIFFIRYMFVDRSAMTSKRSSRRRRTRSTSDQISFHAYIDGKSGIIMSNKLLCDMSTCILAFLASFFVFYFVFHTNAVDLVRVTKSFFALIWASVFDTQKRSTRDTSFQWQIDWLMWY